MKTIEEIKTAIESREQELNTIPPTDSYVYTLKNEINNLMFEYVDLVEDEMFVHELYELLKAKVEGRLVALPCKVGDVLYVLTSDSLTGIEETKCRRISIRTLQDGSVAKAIAPCVLDDWGGAFREFYIEDFGKTVFLSRAEAEKALTERKK